MQKLMLLLATLVLFLPNLYKQGVTPELQYDGMEKFDPSLTNITSIAQLQAYTDSVAVTKNISASSFNYVELLEWVIAKRFYHGFSHYTLQENWIAALAGKWVTVSLSCKVDPEEIMKHANAACSQQAMVMMAILRNKNIDYRSLGFPHHYAMEVLIDKQWYFFDTNMEPAITPTQRLATNWQYQNDQLKKYYDTSKHKSLDYQFGNKQVATIGPQNEVPAQRATLFHSATGIVSQFGWLLPLAIFFLKGGIKKEVPFVALMVNRKKKLVSLPV